MKLFRGKPKSTPRSPALDQSDLHKIDPYTLPSPAIRPPSQSQPQTQSRATHSSSSHGSADSRDTLLARPQRRQSLKARSSTEETFDPWVVVSEPASAVESRTSSIASLPPGASPQYPQNTPYSTPTNANPLGSYPANPTQPPAQHRQPSVLTRRAPPNPSTQQQQLPVSGGPKVNGPLTTQSHPPTNGRTSQENLETRSIQSQQENPKAWAKGFWGTSATKGGKDAEGTDELMRMIGFLIAVAPDDFSLLLEVSERASANEGAAKEAAKGLRKEFKYAKAKEQLNAAKLWALMMQHAGDLFLVQTASRKFLDSLEGVITAPDTSPVVRERLIDVLASAAYTYGRQPGKEGFMTSWKRVRPAWKPEEGMPFEPEDTLLDPTTFGRRSGVQQIPPGGFPPPSSKKHRGPPNQPVRKDRGIIPLDEDIRRLFEECDIAKHNARLLNEQLVFATPATMGADQLLQEFHAKCRASQELIAASIPWASAGAERSRNAVNALKKPSADANGKTKKPPAGPPESTKEERLLAALLAANQDLLEVFRVYDELEQMAIVEMDEREAAQRSIVETKIDRSQLQYLSPDGTFIDGQRAGASSSSRSPSPSPALTQAGAINAKVQGARELPVPPQADLLPGQQPLGPTSPLPVQSHYPYHPGSHPAYGPGSLAPPPHAPLGPRGALPAPGVVAQPGAPRSRTPSPERGLGSNTVFPSKATPPNSASPAVEYPPPPHPPPSRVPGIGGRTDSNRSTNASPVPGSAPSPGGLNMAGMKIDVAAATAGAGAGGFTDEENVKTPIRPSEKALGKRKAVQVEPDEAELEQQENAELEEACLRSIAPPDVENNQTERVVHYLYDAAAERAKELDRLEKEKEEQERVRRRMEMRQSMQATSAISSAALAKSGSIKTTPPAKVAS